MSAAGGAPGARLGRPHWLLIGALMLAGTALRLWIARRSYGVAYDTDTARITAGLFAAHPLHAYDSLRYPYPPGYLPVLWVSRWWAELTGEPFAATWKYPATFADAGLAAALAWGTGLLGASPRQRVAAVALVALGPIFVIVAGYHGQVDPAAILPALLGVVVWVRGGPRRALWAGLLIGVGAATKTVPGFMVFALLPTVRDRHEAAHLVLAVLAVPALAVLPFLLADGHAVVHSISSNHGVAGLGGPSVLAQPSLTRAWLYHPAQLPTLNGLVIELTRLQTVIDGIGVLLAAAVVLRARLDAPRAACVIWLAVWVCNVNWAYQYFDWGLPFLLLAGWRRGAAALQLLVLIPALEMYFHWQVGTLGRLVIPLSAGTWLLLAAVLLGWAARLIAGARPGPTVASLG